MREALLALLLAAAGVLVVIGVAQWSTGAAWLVGGVLLAGWSVIAIREAP